MKAELIVYNNDDTCDCWVEVTDGMLIRTKLNSSLIRAWKITPGEAFLYDEGNVFIIGWDEAEYRRINERFEKLKKDAVSP